MMAGRRRSVAIAFDGNAGEQWRMSTDKFAALVGGFDLEWTVADGHNH
jgi:hypothetical protein